MPAILATQTQMKDGAWGGHIRVPNVPWDRHDGAGIAFHLRNGYNLFEPPAKKHELSDELIAQIPKVVTYPITKRGMPDICGTHGGELVFSRRVKDKLEELEPGAHDFFPVTVEHPKSHEQLEGRYLAYVWQKPDIIDRSNTYYAGSYYNRLNYFRLLDQSKDYFQNLRYLINFKEPGPGGVIFGVGQLVAWKTWWKNITAAMAEECIATIWLQRYLFPTRLPTG